jgi:hypothetical protein
MFSEGGAVRKVLLITAVLVPIAVMFIGAEWQDRRREAQAAAQVAPWQDRVRSEYMPADKVRLIRSPQFVVDPNARAVIKGRVIPVDMGTRNIHAIHFMLPKELRSLSPDDVGTIMWLQWGKQDVGRYEGGAPARVQTCEVTLIDKATFSVVAQRDFRGSAPPEKISSKSSEGVGSAPISEIVTFLKSLPRVGMDAD